ncbi:S8 family peptidase [Nonomuraea longicatena]|uniref:S8 family serine peptidase n=1 Tax=Nonomuraea longicatena TaxID=83682 RepID=A0ABN1P742_9ACTN
MRRITSGTAALALLGALTGLGPAAALSSPFGAADGTDALPAASRGGPPAAGAARDYLVFYADGRQNAARAAVARAGGTVLSAETRLGYLLARGAGAAFTRALDTDPAVVGVSGERAIGHTASRGAARPRPAAGAATRSGVGAATRPGAGAAPDVSQYGKGRDPLAGRQWDMRMIGADQANRKVPGSAKVLVGIIDTGIDGNHPDIAPNFNRDLSRNFVTDRPKDDNGDTLDGPCEADGCKDPVDRDDEGHGTHVASTVASPLNGLGVTGVAPGVQLVSLRAGQDSGFFFLKPSLDALTYAADIGVDVVNMSYYIDPWLFNCTANKADDARERSEQRAIVTGMQRALDYARGKGVTLIAAIGNGATDLGRPRVDRSSPGYPRGDEKVRQVDNSCLNVPAESKGVISVAAVGPSGRKAVYSDYGLEQADLSAPGGDSIDGKGRSATRSVLAAAPEAALRATGKIDKTGKPATPEVVRDCAGGSCAYYQYLDGSSMAAPHATGVAALIVSRFGKPGRGGLDLDPATVEKLLYRSATPKACPAPRTYRYKIFDQTETHVCEGGEGRNGFFGRGVVNALTAATMDP